MQRHGEHRLTAAEARALDDELLAKIVTAGGVSTIAGLFDGFRPVWAFDACDRLEDRGLVELLPDRRTAVTPEGHREYQRVQREMSRSRPTPADLGRRERCTPTD